MRINELLHTDLDDEDKKPLDYLAVGVPPKHMRDFLFILDNKGADYVERNGALMIHKKDMELASRAIDFLKNRD